jgi:hypothetical protein
LLSIFEVTFDILSLVAALLGGFTRAADSTSSLQGTNTAPEIPSEESHQFASQIAVNETPSRRPIGITIIVVLLGGCVAKIFKPLKKECILQSNQGKTCKSCIRFM